MSTIAKASSKDKIKTLVTAALLCALSFVGTMFIQIPTGTNGYIHVGDAFVLLCGYMLGPVWGALAAGVGSALTDITTGYMLWAPGTFLIKALMATIVYFIFRPVYKISKSRNLTALIIASVVSEVFMVTGYFVYAALILGNGISAATSIPSNLIQGAAGIAISTLLMEIFVNNKTLSHLAPIRAKHNL